MKGEHSSPFLMPFCFILFIVSIRSRLMKLKSLSMKRALFLLIMTIFTTQIFAQEGLKAGINLGLPLGDAAHVSGCSVGIDVLYHWEVEDDIIAGIAIGFTNAFGKSMNTSFGSIEFEDIQFLPISASGRFMPSEAFSVGLDLGYAIGISEGSDGGLYYRPIIGYDIASNTALNLSYTGISLVGGSWSTLNLGVLFNL